MKRARLNPETPSQRRLVSVVSESTAYAPLDRGEP